MFFLFCFFFFSSRRRHTRYIGDWSSDVCSSDLMIRRSRPRNLEDLAVEVAIVRPGPIVGGAVNPYVRRREAQRRAHAEIGRASCRERVEIAVGAGVVKRKRKQVGREQGIVWGRE